jgi:hypothetical protein
MMRPWLRYGTHQVHGPEEKGPTDLFGMLV